MSERYWTRLGELLESARAIAAASLRPNATELAAPEKGLPGVVAHQLQGLSFQDSSAVAQRKQGDAAWTSIWNFNKPGKFVDYGLDLASLAPDVRDWLVAKITAANLTVRIFEADVAFLPIDLSERIIKVRSQMHAVKARVDLCHRILAALEGKAGKKIPEERIAKMKIQLEKLEAKALKQEERMRIAEERAKAKSKAAEERAALAEKTRLDREKNRLDREKKRKEKEDIKNAKESSAKKKMAQSKAQSSFMLRFIGKQTTPQKSTPPSIRRTISLDSPNRPALPIADLPSDIEIVETKFNVPPFAEAWVMSTAIWLRTLVDYDIKAMDLDFLKHPVEGIGISTLKKHLEDMKLRVRNAQLKVSPVLQRYRDERREGRDNKSPRFALRRYQVRGRRPSGVLKLLQFAENHRPAYFGTKRAKSKKITGRRPFAKDESLDLNYDVNSDDEWESEAEDGESLSDIEDEKEMAKEDDELRILYGSDDESDDEDFLDDEGADEVIEDDSDSMGSPEKKNINLAEEVPIVDEKLSVIDVDKLNPVIMNGKKRPADGKLLKEENKRKRRRKSTKGPKAGRVEILGVDYSNNASPLDYYPVTKFKSAPPFVPFDLAEEEKMLAEINTPKKARKTKKNSNKNNNTPTPIGLDSMPTADGATPSKATPFNALKSPTPIKKQRGGIKLNNNYKKDNNYDTSRIIPAPLPPPTPPTSYNGLLPTSDAELLLGSFNVPAKKKIKNNNNNNTVKTHTKNNNNTNKQKSAQLNFNIMPKQNNNNNTSMAASIFSTAPKAQASSNVHQA